MGGHAYWWESSGYFIEFDIRIYGEAWNASGTSDITWTPTTYHEVLLHEFGHAVGLGHSGVSTAVMYPGSYTSDLDPDDIAGIQSIYGFRNALPTSSSGPDQTVDAGTTVILDGSGSSDTDGDPLTYTWSQVSGPSVSLSGSDTATASFVSPVISSGTALVFRLTVNDGYDSDSDTVVITMW